MRAGSSSTHSSKSHDRSKSPGVTASSGTHHYASTIGVGARGSGGNNIPLAHYPPVPQYGNKNTNATYSKHQRGAGHKTGHKTGPWLSLLAKAKFCHLELVACINTIRSSSITDLDDSSPPPLLEVKRLRYNNENNNNTMALPLHDAPSSVFRLETVALSLDSSLSASLPVTSTCLDVASLSTQNSNGASSLCTNPIATGLSTGALCIHTPTEQQQSDDNGNFEFHFTRHYIPAPPTKHIRPVTAVAWKPKSHYGAVAWGKRETVSTGASQGVGASSATTSPIEGMGAPLTSPMASSTASNVSSSGKTKSPSSSGNQSSPGEYGCLVWDIQNVSSSSTTAALSDSNMEPIAKLAPQVGVASLGWVLEGSALAVGDSLRNVYLYDLRSVGSPMETVVYAHNFSVSGIEPDPHRPHQFATFSSMANEPVKLWDARRTDRFVSEIKVGGGATTSGSDVNSVTAIQWSQPHAGILTVAIGGVLHDYDTSSSRPLHVGSVVVGQQQISDVCLYPYKESVGDTWLASLYARRAVVICKDRSIHDVARHRKAPLTISRRDGRLVHGFGSALFVGPTDKGPAAMECLTIQQDEDISATMMRRARCLHVAKYSMDAASNIKMLVEDGNPIGSVSTTRDKLLRLWVWIERIESFCSEPEDLSETSFTWPVRGLLDAGTIRLLTINGLDRNSEEERYCESLACPTYDSPGRKAALAACGWAGRFDLQDVLSKSEELHEFERSAALAVWHGDIAAAVAALQRGANSVRTRASSDKGMENNNLRVSSGYADFMELVSLSIAGYRAGTVSDVWRQACENLLKRSKVSDQPSRLSYMTALLKFLLTTDIERGRELVLSDSNLSLSDRVGFGCKFLARDKLIQYLEDSVIDSLENGNVEGLIVTGMDKRGVRILQTFVDRSSDVQTAALVTSRVVFPVAWSLERSVSAEWLDAYRTLLNTWQMWQSRAMFDVDRASLLRKFKVQQGDGYGKLKKAKPAMLYDPDVQAPVPVQLDARCNYCSAPLLLRNKDASSIEKLSKMKPLLSCCPNCRKPLPRCAICMLSLGAINPYMELLRRMSSSSIDNSTSKTTSLPFAEWFCWCMNCKHGGHATHMVSWFASHEECPVSGCNCRCQFDGVQKLNRPALQQPEKSKKIDKHGED